MRTARAVPKVKAISRHREDCKWAGFPKRVGCDCPKQLTYFREGKLHRLGADTCDGAVAEKKAAEMEAAFDAASKGEPTPVPAGKLSMTLDDAVKTFIASRNDGTRTDKRIRILKFDLGNFSRFALARGLVNVADIKTADCLAYKESLKGHQNTRAKKIHVLIGFFRFCVEDLEIVSRNPAATDSVRIAYDPTQTPKALSNAQFETLLASVPKVNGKTTDEQRRKLDALVLLMRHSGLAIRDAVTVERTAFTNVGNGKFKISLHRAKTGKPVYGRLRADILERIFAGANPDGRFLFIDSLPVGERAMDNEIAKWGTLFSKLGACADLKDEETGDAFDFGSHCLRHTFVFACICAGLATGDIAQLIGDTEATVMKHYSVWIFARQQNLDSKLDAMLDAKPLAAAAGK